MHGTNARVSHISSVPADEEAQQALRTGNDDRHQTDSKHLYTSAGPLTQCNM